MGAKWALKRKGRKELFGPVRQKIWYLSSTCMHLSSKCVFLPGLEKSIETQKRITST